MLDADFIEINKIINSFNKEVSLVCKFCMKKDKNNVDIEWINKIINTLKYENPKYIIEVCIEKLWDNREKIIERDEQFFKNNNVENKYISNDKNKEWIKGIIHVLRDLLFNMNENDKTYIWDRFSNMLELSIKYKMLVFI